MCQSVSVGLLALRFHVFWYGLGFLLRDESGELGVAVGPGADGNADGHLFRRHLRILNICFDTFEMGRHRERTGD